jgi:hypothetical protein
LLIVIFILPASNLWASPVASHSSAFCSLAGYQTAQKCDADFGGQRYVKQAEFYGLTEG